MGCTSAKKKSSWNYCGDSEPSDTQTIASNQSTLPVLNFELGVSNLKLKGVNYMADVSVGFYIKDIFAHKLEKQDPMDNTAEPDTVKWNFSKVVPFQMDELQLRRNFLHVYVNHEEDRVADIQFNLYLIATGPYHLDFPIKYTSKSVGRICIDVRISQIVEAVVSVSSATVTLIKQRPAETFSFNIKAICNTFKSHQSRHSYNQQLLLASAFKKQVQAYNMRSPVLPKQSLVKSTLEEMHKISWEEGEAVKRGGVMPKLVIDLAVGDMHNTSLQFMMWQVVQPQRGDEQIETYALCGECYVAFYRLLQREYMEALDEGIRKTKYTINLTEKIWNKGKLIGDVKLTLQVLLPQFFKQTIVYVRSQQGIQKMTPLFVTTATDKSQSCKQITDILNIQQNIEQILTELGNEAAQGKVPEFKIKMDKRRVFDYLNQLLPILEVSKKESVVIYSYSSEKDLLKGQMTLIDVGFKLEECVEEDDTSLHDICWKCLIAVMKRSQLSLRYLGFSANQKEEVRNNSPSSFTKKKLQLCIKVQTFFYKMLSIVLDSLTKKALQDNERMFVELFCAYSFFRIPQFRKRVLSVIIRPDDQIDGQWRLAQKSQSDAVRSQDSQLLDMLFNWDQNFYKPISSDPRYQQNILELNRLLQNRQWMQRMQKRGVAFFYFVYYWVRYVEQTLIKSWGVKWHYLPNYNDIIRVFLSEMKRRELAEYPDSLVDTSTRLLANERLLYKMIKILFQKTNLFNFASVIKCVEMIDGYLGFLEKIGRSIPTTFNYTFFFSGIREILQSPHCFAVAKCLLMLYRNFNIFSFDFRRDITFYLMGKSFFRMFLNWSSNVRTVFHHLLIFRIYLQANVVPPKLKTERDHEFMERQMLYNDEVKRRYEALMFILDKATKVHKERDNRKFAYNYEKDYSKKMKKKLMDKKKLSKDAPNSNLHGRQEEPRLDQIVFAKNTEKPAPQRHQSEVAHITTVTYPQQFLHQKRMDVNLNSPSKNTTQIFTGAIPAQRQKTETRIDVSNIRRIRPHQQDFEPPTIDASEFSYLLIAIHEFKSIEQKYVKMFGKRDPDIDRAPVLTVKLPLDEAETRPQHLDEW